jgi:hypothetical protein
VVGGSDPHRRVCCEVQTASGEETLEENNGGGGASLLMMGKSGGARAIAATKTMEQREGVSAL